MIWAITEGPVPDLSNNNFELKVLLMAGGAVITLLVLIGWQLRKSHLIDKIHAQEDRIRQLVNQSQQATQDASAVIPPDVNSSSQVATRRPINIMAKSGWITHYQFTGKTREDTPPWGRAALAGNGNPKDYTGDYQDYLEAHGLLRDHIGVPPWDDSKPVVAAAADPEANKPAAATAPAPAAAKPAAAATARLQGPTAESRVWVRKTTKVALTPYYTAVYGDLQVGDVFTPENPYEIRYPRLFVKTDIGYTPYDPNKQAPKPAGGGGNTMTRLRSINWGSLVLIFIALVLVTVLVTDWVMDQRKQTTDQTADANISAQLSRLDSDLQSGNADVASVQQKLSDLQSEIGSNTAAYRSQLDQLNADIRAAINAAIAEARNGDTTTDVVNPPVSLPDFWSTNTGTMPNLPATIQNSHWTITAASNNAGDNPIIATWLKKVKAPDPDNWKVFPNIPNPDVPSFPTKGKQVPQGMYYGEDESPFCENNPCDFQVGAQIYRLITGDYSFMGMQCHQSDGNGGCLLLIINEGGESYTWRKQVADNGFTVTGPYFDGDNLEMGVWGLVSNATANMLNMKTYAHPGEILNSGAFTNSGANCGVPEGCKSVDLTIVVTTGDRIVAMAHTTFSK